ERAVSGSAGRASPRGRHGAWARLAQPSRAGSRLLRPQVQMRRSRQPPRRHTAGELRARGLALRRARTRTAISKTSFLDLPVGHPRFRRNVSFLGTLGMGRFRWRPRRQVVLASLDARGRAGSDRPAVDRPGARADAYCGSTSTLKLTPACSRPAAARWTASPTARTAARRSVAFTTRTSRWRPRRRNSEAGPSTDAPSPRLSSAKAARAVSRSRRAVGAARGGGDSPADQTILIRGERGG